MKSAFEGGVAVVTGAGSGLGAALARRFAAEGMRVVAADLQLADAEATAEALRAEGAEAIAMPVDIGDESSIAHLAERVERELGPCQVLCANVGVQ
jgi:NAD(P)-dependent dehydrogenase (short-subunit alcohol dehydrogenase family)